VSQAKRGMRNLRVTEKGLEALRERGERFPVPLEVGDRIMTSRHPRRIVLMVASVERRWLVEHDVKGLLDRGCEVFRKVPEIDLDFHLRLFRCTSCEDKGWLHMVDEQTGEDATIERCDDCKEFASDDDAQDQHRKDCSCGLKVRR
jgi:hypothetical protein